MDDIVYMNDKNTKDLRKSTHITFKIKPRLRNIKLKGRVIKYMYNSDLFVTFAINNFTNLWD